MHSIQMWIFNLYLMYMHVQYTLYHIYLRLKKAWVSYCKQLVKQKGGTPVLNNKWEILEISAKEAVNIVLQLPMRKSSCQVVFINTSPSEDTVQLLKPLQEINDLEDDSNEIYASGQIKC